MGPTASGKTSLVKKLYQALPVELISVDSALVYRGMDIGTAKPSPQELQECPHRLIDIKDPSESFSVGEFCNYASSYVDEILGGGKIPLFVGGTMMYFNALLNGVSSLPPASQSLRRVIESEAADKGWGVLHNQLQAIDPSAFTRINPNDTQRIQRAHEVFRLTGRTLSDLQSQPVKVLPCDALTIILEAKNRLILHQRIEQRLKHMFDNGFVDEVQKLVQRGDLNSSMPSIRSVGYRQVWEYLSGQSGSDGYFDKALFATRQLAKRQLTWLRRWQDAKRFYIDDADVYEDVLAYIRQEIF